MDKISEAKLRYLGSTQRHSSQGKVNVRMYQPDWSNRFLDRIYVLPDKSWFQVYKDKDKTGFFRGKKLTNVDIKDPYHDDVSDVERGIEKYYKKENIVNDLLMGTLDISEAVEISMLLESWINI
jgi:hypothetical protein